MKCEYYDVEKGIFNILLDLAKNHKKEVINSRGWEITMVPSFFSNDATGFLFRDASNSTFIFVKADIENSRIIHTAIKSDTTMADVIIKLKKAGQPLRRS